MQIQDSELLLSATDLANHLACKHLTELNRLAAEGVLEKPFRTDPILETLIVRGNQHEQAYVDSLKADGTNVVEIDTRDVAEAKQSTVEAIKAGADVIVQAGLSDEQWVGWPDLLVKVDRPSAIAPWSYEVGDTKLTTNTRAGTILQLCLYSDLLSQIQGIKPDKFCVIKPGEPFLVDEFKFNDFRAYYRFVKKSLEDKVSEASGITTYPSPVTHCDICRWWTRCNKTRRDDDHLTFVAGIQKTHIAELERQGVEKFTQFAEGAEPLAEYPKKGSPTTYKRIHEQAKIQLKGIRSGDPETKFLPTEPGKGFNRLPEPSEGDIFFDIEGDPHAMRGGLEYLFGYVLADGSYHAAWSLNRVEEKKMFEDFIDFIMQTWEQHPGMHIYHYAPYEPSAFKRLATRHATREDELDMLLRGVRFIDLYAVVRQGLLASVESYSIKRLERFYEYERMAPLEDARHSLHRLERALELSLPDLLTSDDKKVVQLYNQDDCVSTRELRDWLEKMRSELSGTGASLDRPELKSGKLQDDDEQDEVPTEVSLMIERLRSGIVEPTNPNEEARQLLSYLLEYFRREDKCIWWEFFRMHDLEHQELIRERTALSGLEFQEVIPGPPRSRTPIHRYKYPIQEAAILVGNQLHEIQGEHVGSVYDIDIPSGTIDIKKKGATSEVHPSAIFVHERIRPFPLPQSLLAFAEEVCVAMENGGSLNSARFDLLAKQTPRLQTLTLPIDPKINDKAVTIARDLNNSLLAIQGPPGTGKTHVGGTVISALAAEGKRIGVTAVSHKVITNLLERAASYSDTPLSIAQRTSSDSLPPSIQKVSKSTDVLAAINNGSIVGGTAWVWSREDLEQELDYLFIDEAGQMSLAMALAAGRAAKNIVLLGDPQQLEQPQQGSHPDGAEAAALKHFIGDRQTIEPTKGLFLDYTWRLHPSITKFTSSQFYDGRLVSRYGLEIQAITGNSPFVGSGLFFVPVEHAGNQSFSSEEVEKVSHVFNQLLNDNHEWKDEKSKRTDLQLEDILVVAPYNAQVAELRKSLPNNARVGTVDKFQGQEAPVVIYSLASSSVEDAPRGMEFLFSPNRLNVGTSRARCCVIVVASQSLFQPECKSPKEIRWANAFCKYFELATTISY